LQQVRSIQCGTVPNKTAVAPFSTWVWQKLHTCGLQLKPWLRLHVIRTLFSVWLSFRPWSVFLYRTKSLTRLPLWKKLTKVSQELGSLSSSFSSFLHCFGPCISTLIRPSLEVISTTGSKWMVSTPSWSESQSSNRNYDFRINSLLLRVKDKL
jgi:hypothetical protein